MLLRLLDGSPTPDATPAEELERLRADAVLAGATITASLAHAFGLDPRLRAADLRALARALERAPFAVGAAPD